MVTMLLFWLVYGAWMMFTWTGIVGILVTGASKVVEWITDHDYSLERYADWLEEIVTYNVITYTSFVLGAIVTFIHGFISLLDVFLSNSTGVEGKLVIVSFHEFAVIISEWTSTTMQTPLLVVLALTGMVVLLKKGYPLFKKIKMLTDKL